MTNAPPLGGFLSFRDLGREGSTVATWLQGAGYRTAYFGKYMNGYGTEGTATYILPGWNQWHATTSMSKWSENGTVVDYGSDPDYNQTDLLASKATEYIRSTPDDTRPFFMHLSPRPPHRLAVPAPRHQDAFADIRAPRPPSFNEEDVSDKPGWLQRRALLDSEQIERIDALYHKRLQTLLGLDELIEQVVQALEASGELDNTYVVFASDNGYHLGQHRLTPHKTTAYEEDIRVPLVVRGPGVPAGRELGHLVLNNDFAPTFAQLAGARTRLR